MDPQRMEMAQQSIEQRFAENHALFSSNDPVHTQAFLFASNRIYKAVTSYVVAVGSISKRIAEIVATIFHDYAVTLNREGKKSRDIFLLSLTAQLVACGMLRHSMLGFEPDSDLFSLPERLAQRSFNMAEEVVKKPPQNFCEKLAALGDDGAIMAARNLCWIGSLSESSDSQKEHTRKLARDIYEKRQSEESYWEVAQMILNDCRESPDIQKETLEEVEPFLCYETNSVRAQRLRVQLLIINTNKLDTVSTKNLPEEMSVRKRQLNEVKKAADIACSSEGFDPYLRAICCHDLVKKSMLCNELFSVPYDAKILGEKILESLGVESNRETHHRFHLSCLCVAAELELREGQRNKAEFYIGEIQALCLLHPDCRDAWRKVDQDFLGIK